MKKNPSTIGFIVSVLMFIVAFGIYFLFLAKKNEYLVDNPTNKTYYFKINNGKEMTIASGIKDRIKYKFLMIIKNFCMILLFK